MRMKVAGLLLACAALITGCKGFWDAPSNSSYTLSSGGNMSIAPGGSGTSTITVTPGSSFTGTVALGCSVTSAPTSATSAATCSMSPTSVAISSTTAQTSTLTATTTSTTTAGSYQFSVTGTSGSSSASTTLCAQVTTGSDTCTASTSSSGSGVFYVLNQQTKQVAAYTIASGALTQVSGSPYLLSAAPYSIAIAPNGGFLYVGTAAGIFLYDIGTGGGLTLANSNNVISQDIATTMQVDSTGSWLVEAGPNLAEALALPISTSTGVPTSTIEQHTILPAATVQQLIISPDNAHVFIALGSAGTEDITFAAGNGTPFGSIANVAVVNSAGAAVSVAVDPSSRLLLIGETAATAAPNSGGLRAFNYSTLVEVSGSPYATGGLAPYSIAPTRYGSNAGDYIYVANRSVSGTSSGNIAGFAITTTGTTYTLTALSTTASAGIAPLSLAQDSTGTYLLVVNSGGSPDLGAYTVDTTTAGKLDAAITGATGTDPVEASAVAALP